MTNKIQNTALKFILGAFLVSFTLLACNNEGEKKETPQDSTVIAPPADPMPPAMDDSTVMDSADTKPVKTLD